MDLMQHVYLHFHCTEQAAAPARPRGLCLPRTSRLFDELEQAYGPRKLEASVAPSGAHVAAYAFLNPTTRAYCRISVVTGELQALYAFVLREYAFMSGPLPRRKPDFPSLGDWSYACGSDRYTACTVVLENAAIELVELPDQDAPMLAHCERLVRTLQNAMVPDYRGHAPVLALRVEPGLPLSKLTLHCATGLEGLTLDYFFVGAPYTVRALDSGVYTVGITPGIDYTPVPIAFYATDNSSLLGGVMQYRPETGVVTPV